MGVVIAVIVALVLMVGLGAVLGIMAVNEAMGEDEKNDKSKI